MTTVVFTDLAVSTSLCEQLGDKTESGVVTQVVRVLQGDFEQHHGRVSKLELGAEGETLSLHSKSGMLTSGCANDAGLSLNDPRTPLPHGTLEWHGVNFVLTNASSYGTWMCLGDQSDGVLLRRTECILTAASFIVPGCERADDRAPLIAFSLKS